MKIGILTQPLSYNYGGLLQAWALQTTLERMGHEVIILNRVFGSERGILVNILSYVKNKLLDILPIRKRYLTEFDYGFIMQDILPFVRKYHKKSHDLHNTRELKKYAKKQKFDAFVVGSDQCWRPRLSPNIKNYYLDFTNGWDVKRISYAASFGVDYWEYSTELTLECARLVKDFNAISVREQSGVVLCKQYLGIKAEHVIDPTLLLDKEDYIQLVKNEHEPQIEGNLFCYLLDTDELKEHCVNRVANVMGFTPCYCMSQLKLTFENYLRNKNACIFPSVTKWIRCFMDSAMVVTDSFHGTVFSIIFNKPFWVLGNKARGMARFYSLLSIFGLEDRLVEPEMLIDTDYSRPIDWTRVNEIRRTRKEQALRYLITNL